MTALEERPLDVVLDDYADEPEPGRATKAKASKARNASEMDAAVRRIGERDMARRPGHDPSVRVRRIEPARPVPTANAECAACGLAFLPGEGQRRDPSLHSLLVHTNGGCDRARSRAAARAEQPAAPAPPEPEQPEPAGPAETETVAKWRDEEIIEWLRSEGPKTGAEIRMRFGFPKGSQQGVIDRLRSRGLIEKTGVMRMSEGSRGGRPGPEFRAVKRDENSHARTGDVEAEQPAAETPTGDAAAAPPEPLKGAHDNEDAAAVGREAAAPDQPDGSTVSAARGVETSPLTDPVSSEDGEVPPTRAATMSLLEQLVARYIGVLIGTIERASTLRDEGPPEHVYDRIERLLQIQDGAA